MYQTLKNNILSRNYNLYLLKECWKNTIRRINGVERVDSMVFETAVDRIV